MLLFALVTSNLKCQKSSIFWAHQKKFSKKKMPNAWKSKIAFYFWDALQCFFLHLSKAN
jgi:hypothetical protein